MTRWQPFILVSDVDFDASVLTSQMTADRTDIGAVVSFTGYCRDENKTLQALELEHYPGMAEAQLTKIAVQAIERWPLQALTIVHRYGLINAGEQIVFVATASKHRQAAFEAAEFLMDYLKNDAPFWKKEHLISTPPAQKLAASADPRKGWVEAKSSDTDLKKRWKKH